MPSPSSYAKKRGGRPLQSTEGGTTKRKAYPGSDRVTKPSKKERNDQEMEKRIGKASLKYNIDWKDEQLVAPKGSSDNIC